MTTSEDDHTESGHEDEFDIESWLAQRQRAQEQQSSTEVDPPTPLQTEPVADQPAEPEVQPVESEAVTVQPVEPEPEPEMELDSKPEPEPEMELDSNSEATPNLIVDPPVKPPAVTFVVDSSDEDWLTPPLVKPEAAETSAPPPPPLWATQAAAVPEADVEPWLADAIPAADQEGSVSSTADPEEVSPADTPTKSPPAPSRQPKRVETRASGVRQLAAVLSLVGVSVLVGALVAALIALALVLAGIALRRAVG